MANDDKPPPPEKRPLRRQWAQGSHAGARIERNLPRGVRANPEPDASGWREGVESIIGYTFKDPDILEEALESPGSGVNCVGQSRRNLNDGNRDLAQVGRAIMELDLKDQCYLYQIPSAEAQGMIKKALGSRMLAKIGTDTRIESFIRPRSVRRKPGKNLVHMFKDDGRENPSKAISRGVAAIVGAAYYDGGLEAANKVLTSFGIVIEGSP